MYIFRKRTRPGPDSSTAASSSSSYSTRGRSSTQTSSSVGGRELEDSSTVSEAVFVTERQYLVEPTTPPIRCTFSHIVADDNTCRFFCSIPFCRNPTRHFFSQSRRLLTKIFESEVTVKEKCRCCEFRGKGNKTGVAMLVISLSLLNKTRDTPNRVNREVPKILRYEQLSFIKER
jgi:hypothetical protein